MLVELCASFLSPNLLMSPKVFSTHLFDSFAAWKHRLALTLTSTPSFPFYPLVCHVYLQILSTFDHVYPTLPNITSTVGRNDILSIGIGIA